MPAKPHFTMLKNSQSVRQWRLTMRVQNFQAQCCSSAALLRVGEHHRARCANDATFLYLFFCVAEKRVANFFILDRSD